MSLKDIFRKKQIATEDEKEIKSLPLSAESEQRLFRLELQFEELRKLLLEPSKNNPKTQVLSYRGKRIKASLRR